MFRPSFLPLVVLMAACPAAARAALPDEAIRVLRAETAARREAFFRKHSGEPFRPGPIRRDWNGRGDYTRLYNQSVILFASRALALGEQLPEANRALREMCQYHLDRPVTLREIHSFPQTLGELPRLCRDYGPAGRRGAGRLEPATHALLLRTMWEWARDRSRIADAERDRSRTWWIADSENHHAIHFTSCWGVALALAGEPSYRERPYDDGSTPAGQAAAWTAYAGDYLAERGRRGMTVEIDSPSYAVATLGAAYRIHALTDDPRLRRRAAAYVTLFWALWAEQQIDGVGGGAKTRCYPDSARRGTDFLRRAAWYTLGLGEPGFTHSGMLPLVTSDVELPDLLYDLAHDVAGRGAYEIVGRRVGLAEPGFARPPLYRLLPDAPGLVRYGYVTPDFILGSFRQAAAGDESWAAISAQNRWSGVIFRGDPDARIYPAVVRPGGGAVLNAFWAVQARGALVARRLGGAAPDGEWRVYFSRAGLTEPRREGGWVFTEAPGAWAAVRVAAGEFTWTAAAEGETGRWLRCLDPDAPVVLEVASRAAFPDPAAFRRAVLALPVAPAGADFTHRTLGGDLLTLPAGGAGPARINGRPVDLAPARACDSPHVQADWGRGVILLRKGARRLELDFN